MTENHLKQIRAELAAYRNWLHVDPSADPTTSLHRLAKLCEAEFGEEMDKKPDPPFMLELGFEVPQPVLTNGPVMYSQKSHDGVRLWVYCNNGSYTALFGTDAEQAKSDMSIGPGVVKTRRDLLDLLRLYNIPTERAPTFDEVRADARRLLDSIRRDRKQSARMMTPHKGPLLIPVEEVDKLLAYIDGLEQKLKSAGKWREVQIVDYYGKSHGVVSDKNGVLVIGSLDYNCTAWAHGERPPNGAWMTIENPHTRYIVTADEDKPAAK